eukprot:scaffold4620_cov58-Phaeocystis_antarctica.AAC.3
MMYCGPASDASAEERRRWFLEKTSPAFGNCLSRKGARSDWSDSSQHINGRTNETKFTATPESGKKRERIQYML